MGKLYFRIHTAKCYMRNNAIFYLILNIENHHQKIVDKIHSATTHLGSLFAALSRVVSCCNFLFGAQTSFYFNVLCFVNCKTDNSSSLLLVLTRSIHLN